MRVIRKVPVDNLFTEEMKLFIKKWKDPLVRRSGFGSMNGDSIQLFIVRGILESIGTGKVSFWDNRGGSRSFSDPQPPMATSLTKEEKIIFQKIKDIMEENCLLEIFNPLDLE